MTLEQLIALLTAKFSGVRKDGLAQLAKSLVYTVTTEEEAQALVEKLTDQQVTEFVKDWRKEVDAEVSKGVQTAEGNFKKKYKVEDPNPNPNPSPDPNPNPNDPVDINATIQKAIAEAVKPFQEKLSRLEGDEIFKSRKSTLETKLEKAPETFRNKILKDFSRMSFEDDEKFTEYLTETENDLKEFEQEFSNSGLRAMGKPFRAGGGEPEVVSSAVKDFVESKKEGSTSALGGKEV